MREGVSRGRGRALRVFTVRETGDYRPDEHTLASLLTARQREVLEAAVEIGYYGEPRQATLADVADEVGLARSTVGEHLRRVEKQIFEMVVHYGA